MREGWAPPGHGDGIEVPFEVVNEGNCRGERLRPTRKKDIWFPPDGFGKTPPIAAVEAARTAWDEFCSTCPVKERCLRHALEHEVYGTWAGTTDVDRRHAREEMHSPTKDPELMEYMMNRVRAGFVPFPLPTCSIKQCQRSVSRQGDICTYHKRAMKSAATKARRRT